MPSRSGSPSRRRTDYSTTPLVVKLGIKAGSDVVVVGAPEGFEEHISPLPDGATLHSRPRGELDVAVLFVTSGTDLRRRFPTLAKRLRDAGGLWVAWPKKASRVESDLTFDLVQRAGLGAGLVDNKSASIDETWQALRFVVRREDRGRR